MTTLWKPAGEWKGETVAVLAAGPSMCPELAESLRQHRCIVVNDVHELAPWADMLVGLDGNWPQAWREFSGMRVTGIEDDSLDAFYIGHVFERVALASGAQVEIRNSGLAAVRMAGEMGAARVILAGFEPEAGGRFQGEPDAYVGVAEGLAAIVSELRGCGVLVEWATCPE